MSRLRITFESQIKKPVNEVQTQTVKENIEGNQYFNGAVQYDNPVLARISQRLYDDRVYEEEKHHYHSSHFNSNILPPIVH